MDPPITYSPTSSTSLPNSPQISSRLRTSAIRARSESPLISRVHQDDTDPTEDDEESAFFATADLADALPSLPDHLLSDDPEDPQEHLEFLPEDLEHSGPVSDKMPQACIFVANLDAGKSDTQLFESMLNYFSTYGRIAEVKIDRDNLNRPFAFVQFSVIRDARRVLRDAQGAVIDSRVVRLEEAKVVRTLRAKYNPNWSADNVQNHFKKFGYLEDFAMLRHRDTNDYKGIVYIKYFSRADAIQAYLHTRKLAKWSIDWVKPNTRPLDHDPRSLFIGNLNPDRITLPLLRAKFTNYGEIISSRLFTPPAAKHAFAFVQYGEDGDASLAIDELHGSLWLGSVIKVMYREQRARNSGAGLDPTAQEFVQQPPQPVLQQPAQQQVHQNVVATPPPVYQPYGFGYPPPMRSPSVVPVATNPSVMYHPGIYPPQPPYHYQMYHPVQPHQVPIPMSYHPVQGVIPDATTAYPSPPPGYAIPPGWHVVIIPHDYYNHPQAYSQAPPQPPQQQQQQPDVDFDWESSRAQT